MVERYDLHPTRSFLNFVAEVLQEEWLRLGKFPVVPMGPRSENYQKVLWMVWVVV